jgi:hypothetical protein
MHRGSQFDSSLALLLVVGTFIAAGLLVTGILFGGYRRYKKPLLEVDATLKYSFSHYLKLVVLPQVAYRLRTKFSRKYR